MSPNLKCSRAFTTALFVSIILFPFYAMAQNGFVYPDEYLLAKTRSKSYTSEQLNRMADLGKLWGAIHYFNPKMNTGTVTTDSLALAATRQLLDDPSAAGFRRSVETMLQVLGDKSTRLITPVAPDPSVLFTRGSAVPVVHQLPGDIFYIALPTTSVDAIENPAKIKGLMPGDWKDAKAVIIDLRNERKTGPYDDYNFLFDFMPLLVKGIAGGKNLPAIYEKGVYHNGFVSQSNNNPNIYSSGWNTTMSGNYTSATTAPAFGKPVTFVYNAATSTDLVKQLSSLKAAGLARLVYEGDPALYPQGDYEKMILADSLQVLVRLTEYQLPGGRPLPLPDLMVGRITDTTLNGSFISSVLNLSGNEVLSTAAGVSEPGDFQLARPSRFGDTLVPPASQRLYGLYNFWNAIHYFSPYQKYQDHSWDSVLVKYIPVFLNADDSGSYNLAVRALASETQDCHGFVGSSFATTPARKMYGAWPGIDLKFIAKKLYVTGISTDSGQAPAGIRLWDEVTTIGGYTIPQLKTKWRQYFATSNEDTYERDLVNFLVNGPLNSTVKVEVLRGGKKLSLDLKRTGRWSSKAKPTDFNHQHKTAELLAGNIGYINMGSLSRAKVDSTMQAFKDTRAIIFDIRNYPQGTAWNIVPMLATKPSDAVMFEKPYVTLDYLRGGENKSTLHSFFTAVPSGGPSYKGKVVILCNETTQSQAEYSIMMFQGSTKCTVVGSRTAGADGNVTDVVLPGGYTITFSGLGIYYPDGGQTQRSGIRVDLEQRPTLAGLKAGRDEVLERGIEVANRK